MKLSDQQLMALIEGCRKSSRESQKQLYGFFHSYALGICVRYTRNQEEAMEVVNDGFLKLFKEVTRFDTNKYQLIPSFKGWLKRIMIFTAIDAFRSTQKHQQHQEVSELIIADQEQETALDQLSYEELIGTIQQLSPAYRTVFNLHVIDGFSHEEIAARLHISVGTSKSNLAKARANLREFIKKSNQEAHARYVR